MFLDWKSELGTITLCIFHHINLAKSCNLPSAFDRAFESNLNAQLEMISRSLVATAPSPIKSIHAETASEVLHLKCFNQPSNTKRMHRYLLPMTKRC